MTPLREYWGPPPEGDGQADSGEGLSRENERLTVAQATRMSRIKIEFVKDFGDFQVISRLEGCLGTKTGSKSCTYRPLNNSDGKRK